MLEQAAEAGALLTLWWLLGKGAYHFAQDGDDGVEALWCMANIIQASVVIQNLLDDERGHLSEQWSVQGQASIAK